MAAHDIRRYALIATASLLSGLSEKEMKGVESAILFGSAARGDATEESDVDVFFNVGTLAPERFKKSLRARLNKIADNFYLSNAALEFKLKGISNELSIFVGRLEEWTELARSVASHGIVLYGRYSRKPPDAQANTILSWEKPGKSKGAFLNKIYGYRAARKRYPGLLKKLGGTKLGPATIMVRSSERGAFIDALEKYGINYSRHDVWA